MVQTKMYTIKNLTCCISNENNRIQHMAKGEQAFKKVINYALRQ